MRGPQAISTQFITATISQQASDYQGYWLMECSPWACQLTRWLVGLEMLGKILEYGVRFTKPVVVPAKGRAVITVVAKVAELDPEAKKARIDLQTSFDGNNVLGKSQVWVQL